MISQNLKDIITEKYSTWSVQVLEVKEIFQRENAYVIELKLHFINVNATVQMHVVLVHFPEINMYFSWGFWNLNLISKQQHKNDEVLYSKSLYKLLIFIPPKSTN